MNILEKPSLALLIDCWKDMPTIDKQTYNNTIKNIVSFCQYNKFIKSVALATYYTNTDNGLSLDECHFSQSEQLFYNEINCKFLKDIWNSISWLTPSQTHPLIANMNLRADQIKFSVFDALQVLYYCNSVNKEIENIYICGFEWDLCVKIRPAGWAEFLHLSRLNLFKKIPNIIVNKKCIGGAGLDKNFIPDQNNWLPIDNNNYLLNINSYL